MHHPSRSAFFALACGFLSACAAIDPNPNIGLNSTDALLAAGKMQEAMDVALPRAKAGEPWAQYRVGMILIDERQDPKDVKGALYWLQKAAAYESKTGWERGESLSSGPTGYFNTRASSAKAALGLAFIFQQFNQNEAAWYWLYLAERNYDSGGPELAELQRRRGEFEAKLAPERVKRLYECGYSLDECK